MQRATILGCALIWATLSAAGCSGSTDSGGQAGQAGQGGQAGGGSAGACSALESWTCSQAKPCGDAHFDGQHLPSGSESATAARCILEKLRDRVVGAYHYSSDIENFPPGQWTISNNVDLLLDGTAVDRRAEFHDISGVTSTAHVTLKPASFFDDCLTQSDAELYGCLTSWHGGQAGQCPICP